MENMDEYSLDLKHAYKWFEPEELKAIIAEREKKLAEAEPVQMSFFD